MKNHSKTILFGVGLLLSSTLGAYAIPVTFQVDMSILIASGAIDPATSTVEARGSFQDAPTWSGGFGLTNSTAAPNIFSGTYEVAGTAGTSYEYKFVYNANSGCGDSWESRGNRSFVLAGPSQTLPLAYFNDVSAAPPQIAVTFRVDMSVQVGKGNFDPSADSVEARGGFQSPCTWTSGFPLTNSPEATNIFTGTYVIKNTAANGLVEYKFWSSSSLGWEGVANRTFNLPASATNLPVVYFNNDIGSLVPVTFQVDMSAAVLAGSFIPESDYVEARGSFQSPATWTGGFTLNNDPAGTNKNLYSGTYLIAQSAGSRIEYKFYASGTLGWESPASTGGGNRSFTLAATAQTLIPVYFNDVSPSDLLGEDTLVTFQVNMTNAQAIAWNSNPAFVFNPATDGVYLNGAFIPWWNWSVDFPPPDWKMTNAPGVQVYSIAVPFLKGRPVGISYKYGINGGDNEAVRDANHFRYIRSVGTYMMPMDTFGAQYVEPAVGDLTIGSPVNGKILVSWMGRPGVHLQSSSPDLNSWVDHMATDSLSSTNYPMGPGDTFFRLIKP